MLQSIINIERAIGDFKKGIPLIVKTKKDSFFLFSVENNYNLEIFQKITSKETKFTLTIPKERSLYLFGLESASSCLISREMFLQGKIFNICSNILSDENELKNYDFHPSYDQYLSAIKFAKLSEVIPSVITFPLSDMTPNDYNFLSITEEEIENYLYNCANSIVEASRAKLTLKHAKKSEIIAFRIFGYESYAIIVGDPGETPLIRLHSSCYTGDLLSSLSCDCHDQLQEAIKFMGQNNGGVLIYMMQEGRNIGLINKIRVYGIKAQGIDTVDANTILGFSKDERSFIVAASMLKHLGYNKIKIFSNNPAKSKELEKHGIEILERVPHIVKTNESNYDYIRTKANRLNHDIPEEI